MVQIAGYGNVKGTIHTGYVGSDDFTDEDFKYELMWTGRFHAPAEEQKETLNKLGLILSDGTTPTIRKVPIDINHNNGTGARWYMDEKGFRTLGQMEVEIGISSQAMMEAWGYGRPAKLLSVAYECDQCGFACGSATGLEAHKRHVHDSTIPAHGSVKVEDEHLVDLRTADSAAPEAKPEQPSEHLENPRGVTKCAAKTASGSQCQRDAIPGSPYCNHPAHQKLAKVVEGVTTSDNQAVAGTAR